jgi:hypothetical protein
MSGMNHVSIVQCKYSADGMQRRFYQSLCWIPLALIICSMFKSTLKASPWSEISPMAWSDFEGNPPPLSPTPSENYDAFVYTEIQWDFTWDVSTRTLEYEAQAVFIQSVSWVRPSMASPLLLTHEAAHFDFAEIHARKLKRRVSESLALKELLRRCDVSEFEIGTLLTQFHAEEINELNFNNEFYDFQTDHGQNMTVQNTFTNGSIPDELSGLNAFSDPKITITVENEGAKPITGDYEGSLSYTLQVGSSATVFGGWQWTLQGQWQFSFTADEASGMASWSHQTSDLDYSGHLLNVTMPTVPAFPSIDVSIEGDASGDHFWMNFSGIASDLIPSHELTFKPVSIPLIPMLNPGNTTIDFANGAAIALGHWMKEYGNTHLMMKAPVTCPEQTIHYEFSIDDDQLLMMDWVLTRVSDSQGGMSAGGSGSGGIGAGTLPISGIEYHPDTGMVSLLWTADAAGENYSIEASEDLLNWTAIGGVSSDSPGTVIFEYDTHASSSAFQFFRILPDTH